MRLNNGDEVIYVRVFTEKDLRDYAENATFGASTTKVSRLMASTSCRVY